MDDQLRKTDVTRWLLGAVLLAAAAAAQSKLEISPALITQCGGPYQLGRAKLTWSSPGPGLVQVRVHSPAGPTLTGPASPTGSAETGDWVTDGTVFVLIEAGTTRELARATAQVACAAFDQQAPAALAAGAYLPLQVGNQWVYRVSDRFVTSRYFTWRVVRAERISGVAWFVVVRGYTELDTAAETRMRLDEQGRVLTLNAQGQQAVLLDPTTPPDPAAIHTIDSRGRYESALGSFSDALFYSTRPTLTIERGVYGRGIGLLSYQRTMLTGSSGGFLEGGDLVYARVGGRLFFTTQAVSLELSAERDALPVSTGGVTNCAIPCYYAACGLGSPVDPPGTYKPCFQARLRVGGAAESAAVTLELLDSSGVAVVSLPQPAARDATIFRQIPLYSAPNQPFPAGAYRLRARAALGGQEVASSTLAIRVE
jgi:hypothetical protein